MMRTLVAGSLLALATIGWAAPTATGASGAEPPPGASPSAPGKGASTQRQKGSGAEAAASAAAGTPVGTSGARLQREVHRLEATGAAAADLRAPSAEIARVRAERTARGRAEQRLRAALQQLVPTLDEAACAARLAQAQVSSVRYGSDGTVELRVWLSVDGLELAGGAEAPR